MKVIEYLCTPDVYNEIFLIIFGALVTGIIAFLQWLFNRSQLWQGACESMLHDLENLYLKIEILARNPQGQNHISFQFVIENCKHMVKIKGRKFCTKKTCIHDVQQLIDDAYFEIVLNPENEKVINVSGLGSQQYNLLMVAVKDFINKASDRLLA
jgi:hypothetical protein